MDSIDKLTEVFKEFPGIGARQARRFVYFLMSRDNGYSYRLAESIKSLKKNTTQCKECFRYFSKEESKGFLCGVCADLSANKEILLVVEKDSDFESIKKSHVYDGKYFILGGLVPIVDKNIKKYLRIEELKNQIISNGVKEIILAFSSSPNGDHTDFYLRNEFNKMCEEKNIKISSLGRGLSTGTELEYSDNKTIENALKNRQ